MSNLAATAVAIANALDRSDVIYLTDDDQTAEALADAVRAIAPDFVVVFLPSSDALPGDLAPASPANSGSRVAALRQLRAAQRDCDRPALACILSGEAAARRYPPPEAFDTAPPRLAVGDVIDGTSFVATLEMLGYIADDRVDEPGEMAIRGDVIDLFPADAGLPARIEIANGEITAIRAYDPATQRTASDLEFLEIGRANEPPISTATSILAHIPAALLGSSQKAEKRRRRFLQLAIDAAEPGTTVDAIDEDHWRKLTASCETFALPDQSAEVPRFAQGRAPLAALMRYAKPLLGENRRFILVGSVRDIRFLRAKLAQRLACEVPMLNSWAQARQLKPGSAGAIVMPVGAGFVDDSHLVVAAGDLLGSRALLGDMPRASNTTLSGGAEVRTGDVIVHEDHGVGMVAGLEPAPASQGQTEMIALEYAGGARRLVAVDDAERIWRYGADAGAVTLDKLDGTSWAKRRSTIDAAIADSARALTALAEERATISAPKIDPDPAAYERFVSGFAFNETSDQARAITAVRDDLASGKPMDRLVLGDVGYGKTEVALRAAALAAFADYQVVIAAPTTVLVRQHLENFRKRFAGINIEVAGLSRLSSAAEKKAVKAGLADGSIKVVVGTGAVMAKSVTYANLGLVIVDEEQRFGAADKARLRVSGNIHFLTLSATPIPRTLQMALVGLQQISIIATPPARRQPIRTSLDHFDDGRIRTALQREKARGGQSFFVVPRIEDIPEISQKLRRIVPDLDLVEAHGKMPPSQLDEVMVEFADGRGDVLLATNIIEAGLDVPRANTIIVFRADRFGLAQLHQLRGRVGRGNRRGQVILLTDASENIAERTLKRLRTLATFDRLGAGFEISAKDLDMRGGGDLLGETQAGHVKLIGIDLYQHLLEAALLQAQGQDVAIWSPELNMGSPGAFPSDWIPEADLRLALYVRLGRLSDEPALDAFEVELIDRFGPLPVAAEDLLARARLRSLARTARIARIDAGPAGIAFTPRPDFVGETSLTKKDGRFLLAEATTEANRVERVQALLEAFAT